jgi:hypothetical protein
MLTGSQQFNTSSRSHECPCREVQVDARCNFSKSFHFNPLLPLEITILSTLKFICRKSWKGCRAAKAGNIENLTRGDLSVA